MIEKLKFIDNGNTWTKIIEDLDGNVLEQSTDNLSDENRNKQYFDHWENQIRIFPDLDVVEVERFI
jgi:hypothetical protein